MTDKQTIIDGCDVSRCEKQGETIAGITCGNGKRIRFANEIITQHKLCKDNPNCIYKQLKRVEQKLDKIQTICEKETTKSTFYNGIENKDLQKLAIKILKIIEGKNNG